MANKVLILGAGASNPYGFPVGGQLKQDLCSDNWVSEISDPHSVEYRRLSAAAKDLAGELAHSGHGSIDAFLARRSDLQEVGRLGIAAVLSRYERIIVGRDSAQSLRLEQGWYAKLFHSVFPKETPKPSRDFAIITFNYTRSLEASFIQMLCHSFNLDPSEAAEIVQRLPIYHVHGQLQSPMHYDRGKRRTIVDQGFEGIAKSAQTISVLPKDLVGPVGMDTTYLTTNAKAVYFLGFGYHFENLKKIGIHPDLSDWAKGDRSVTGTALGIHNNRRQEIQTFIGNGCSLDAKGTGVEEFFDEMIRL